jgi:hypothetical protein
VGKKQLTFGVLIMSSSRNFGATELIMVGVVVKCSSNQYRPNRSTPVVVVLLVLVEFRCNK